MSTYVTIDGGTTNTRLFLVRGGKIIDRAAFRLGAGAGADGMAPLRENVKNAIGTLLARNTLREEDVRRVLASGMITSEFGLCCLDHIEAPAGIGELHRSLYETSLPEIAGIPFAFIRGVKKTGRRAEETDVMRGEETELMGIVGAADGTCAYVLPGSHSKIIRTDGEGRIRDFSTMLTGEMVEALSRHTILKSAVDLTVSRTDADALLAGYDYCGEAGVNQALFKTRLLKTVFHADPAAIYSFFLGAVLCGEIGRIAACDAETIVLGGRAQLRAAEAELLRRRTNKNVVELDDRTVDDSTALGAVRIFEYAEANV